MFHRIVLFKLADDAQDEGVRTSAAATLRGALARRGHDAVVGVPLDEAAAKSWDLSLVVRFRTRAQAESFDVDAELAGVPALTGASVVVRKTWAFEG